LETWNIEVSGGLSLAHNIAHTPQKKAVKAKGYSDPEAFVSLYTTNWSRFY